MPGGLRSLGHDARWCGYTWSVCNARACVRRQQASSVLATLPTSGTNRCQSPAPNRLITSCSSRSSLVSPKSASCGGRGATARPGSHGGWGLGQVCNGLLMGQQAAPPCASLATAAWARTLGVKPDSWVASVLRRTLSCGWGAGSDQAGELGVVSRGVHGRSHQPGSAA